VRVHCIPVFEAPKRDSRGRLERRPWDEIHHNVFLAVVPEVPEILKTGVPLRWIETDPPRSGPIYRLTTDSYIDQIG